MTSAAIQELIAHKPELKSAKEKLASMEPGAYCVHRSWGFGRIKAYDEVEKKLVIDFESKAGHRMDPVFCIHTMEVLPERHVLVLKEKKPAEVARLAAEDPVKLVRMTLEALPNHAATVIELESTLSRVIGEDKFKRWWSATKRQLFKEPSIAVPAKKTECYFLRDEPVSEEDEWIEEFKTTRSARRRIVLAQHLHAKLGGKASDQHRPILEGLTSVVRESNQLDTPQRLLGAWVRDDFAKALGEDPALLSPSAQELVAEKRTLDALASKLPVGVHVRFLELLMAAHPLEWKDIVFLLLKTSQGKFTTDCINFLVEHGHAAELAQTLARWQTEQNLRAPVLLWIVKNRHSKKFSKLLHDLITPRLLSSIFYAIDYEALQSASSRRIPLADVLSDDTELIPDLLATADAETARDLANTLLLNQGFEELTKKSLLARFIKIFPSVQGLIAGEDEGEADTLFVSRPSHERKQAEYEALVGKKIPENSRAIAAAREHGDLRENSEFKMAKQDQQVLMAQKAQLEHDLACARITDFSDAPVDQIGVGSVVTLRSQDGGQTVRYTLLGAWDSDPANGIISYKTPLGQNLLGRKAGNIVKILHEGAMLEYEVIQIERHAR